MKSFTRQGLLLALSVLLISCSSAKKKATPELSELEGKKVALVEVEGESTPRKIIEVALVNQLVHRGTFNLIAKQDVEASRVAVDQDPTDWKGIAKRAGADYALRAKVLKFEAPIHEGYSSEEVYDSQLAHEMGTDGKTQQVYKIKAMEGDVQIQLQFTRLEDGDTRTGIAQAQQKVEASAKTSSIHLPPQLRFLEDLSNKAFKEFFEKNY
jgi:hypothetical protein